MFRFWLFPSTPSTFLDLGAWGCGWGTKKICLCVPRASTPPPWGAFGIVCVCTEETVRQKRSGYSLPALTNSSNCRLKKTALAWTECRSPEASASLRSQTQPQPYCLRQGAREDPSEGGAVPSGGAEHLSLVHCSPKRSRFRTSEARLPQRSAQLSPRSLFPVPP